MDKAVEEVNGAKLFSFVSGDATIKVIHKGKRLSVEEVAAHRPDDAPDAPTPHSSDRPNPKKMKTSVPLQALNFTMGDAYALLVLLRIVHLQFSRVRESPLINDLVQIAVLCDKYDCVHLVKPWISGWLLSLQEQTKSDLDVGGKDIFICWVFSRQDLFKSFSITYLKQIWYHKDQEAKGIRESASFEAIPPGLMENITKIREETIWRMLTILYGWVEVLAENSMFGARCKQRLDECDALVYGSLLRGCQEHELWPKKQASEITYSISFLAHAIQSIKVHIYPDTVHNDETRSHQSCYPQNLKAPWKAFSKAFRILLSNLIVGT